MINVFKVNGEWEVWHDVEELEKEGVCIGCDKSLNEALHQAYHELSERLKDVERRIREQGAAEQEMDDATLPAQ